MTRSVWRIATDTPRYTADDLSGAGAKLTGGRWNELGVPIVYSSESRALACLETLIHVDFLDLPYNRYLVRIEIPEAIWDGAQRYSAATLPIGWDTEPAGAVSIAAGSDWVASGATCLLLVPSVIVPEEQNILINPAHPDINQLTIRKMRRWLSDPRFGY